MHPPQVLDVHKGAASSHFFPNDRMAFIVTYALLAALSPFVITALPRAVARLLSPGARSLGWTIRHSTPGARDPLRRVPTPTRSNWNSATYEKKQSHAPGGGQNGHWTDHYGIQAPRVAPRHIPSLRTRLFPLSRQFNKTIGDYSVGQLIILSGYAVIIGFGIFYKSNPVTNPKRAGWIFISQLPVVVLLTTKNSLIGLLIGRGYEKLSYLHRWVGWVMLISILFHVVSFLVIWTKAGSLTARIKSPIAVTGLAALGGLTLLVAGSLRPVRNRLWTVFSCSHWIGFCALLITAVLHVPEVLLWCLVAAGVFGLDLLLRLIQTHYVTATIHYMPELKATRVVIPELGSGWRAGQHIRLTVPSLAMGVTQALESHPFTIGSTSEDEDGMVLYCREAGDWTRSLAHLARGASHGGLAMTKFREAGFGAGRRINVLVQGPYGGPGNTIFSSYSAAMFICGGGGITFGLCATQDVIRDAFDRRSRLRIVDLVWSIHDPSAIVPLLPAFTQLMNQAEVISSVSLRINVHYTRAFATSTISVDELELPNGLTLSPGRPEISDLLSASIGCTSALKRSTHEGVHGVVVGVCGPEELMGHVRQVENAIGSRVRSTVGGVELVEEAFAW